MDACIVTSGTGNAFPKDTGNSQILLLGTQEVTHPIEAASRVGMRVSQQLLMDRQRSLQVMLRRPTISLIEQQHAKIPQTVSCVRMFLTKHLDANGECALQQPTSAGQIALRVEQHPQVIEAARGMAVIRPQTCSWTASACSM
jgi:hypothetical protein